MNDQDREAIFSIAIMAALADGGASTEEKLRLQALGSTLGHADLDKLAGRIALGTVSLAETTTRLSDGEAQRLAYDTAVAVCLADGVTKEGEKRFLGDLRRTLGLDESATDGEDRRAAAVAGAPIVPAAVEKAPPVAAAALDDLILQQAVLGGAIELLPDRLANLAILPVQLQMVYRIGQAYGQAPDVAQARDLAGALGIGAAAQIAETVVRRVLGGISRGVLGRAVGGVTGIAAGAAVTFASTYALGHVAKQYYAQGRKLSADDLRRLFARFQEEALTLYPKVREQIEARTKDVDLKKMLESRG